MHQLALTSEKQLYELLQQGVQTMQKLLVYAREHNGVVDNISSQALAKEIEQVQHLAQVSRNEEPFVHDFYYFVEMFVEEVINARRLPALSATIYEADFGKQLETIMLLLREMVARNPDAKAVLNQAPQRQNLAALPPLEEQKTTIEAFHQKYQAAEQGVELANQENMKLARRLQLRIKEKKGLDQPPPADPYETTLRTFALGAAATLVAEELELARSMYLRARKLL